MNLVSVPQLCTALISAGRRERMDQQYIRRASKSADKYRSIGTGLEDVER